jgi:hypothetical protein
MNFIGIDPRTDRFTRCYRDEHRWANPKGKLMKPFDLTAEGQAAFYATLLEDTYVLPPSCLSGCSRTSKRVIIAYPYELKQISLARNK